MKKRIKKSFRTKRQCALLTWEIYSAVTQMRRIADELGQLQQVWALAAEEFGYIGNETTISSRKSRKGSSRPSSKVKS